MTISGFTFMRNVSKLYYPFVESIRSILPMVDEFVIVMGDNDSDDTSLAQIEAIGSDKIKIFHSVWDRDKYPNGMVYAQQTDEAMGHCRGDWLCYLQSDEVVHERDLATIKSACEYYLDKPKVEGLLFGYTHFWGDYDHYHHSHGWYKNEIRIVRRGVAGLHSWRDAQSFRVFEDFKGDYMQKEGSRKLNVAKIEAQIYHYGWVRPPTIMGKKNHDGSIREAFDYGEMRLTKRYLESHPAVMEGRVASHDWGDLLYDSKPIPTTNYKHQKGRTRFLTWIEGALYRHKDELFGFKNYKVIENFHAN